MGLTIQLEFLRTLVCPIDWHLGAMQVGRHVWCLAGTVSIRVADVRRAIGGARSTRSPRLPSRGSGNCLAIAT
jgi:hypothetical protein